MPMRVGRGGASAKFVGDVGAPTTDVWAYRYPFLSADRGCGYATRW
jgi:hypothetical protein